MLSRTKLPKLNDLCKLAASGFRQSRKSVSSRKTGCMRPSLPQSWCTSCRSIQFLVAWHVFFVVFDRSCHAYFHYSVGPVCVSSQSDDLCANVPADPKSAKHDITTLEHLLQQVVQHGHRQNRVSVPKLPARNSFT